MIFSVQLLLLKAQYLQGTHYSLLCWNLVGLAIRIAQGLGLHDPHTYEEDDVVTREYKSRTWAMCYQLDRTLAMTFGRPLSIAKGTEIIPMTSRTVWSVKISQPGNGLFYVSFTFLPGPRLREVKLLPSMHIEGVL